MDRVVDLRGMTPLYILQKEGSLITFLARYLNHTD